MKIVFLGTPEFAVPSLEILVKNKYNITTVVSAPGKKAGRGLKIKEPAVKEFASAAGLTVMQPEKLSDPGFIASLRALEADLFIVVAFRMLPEVIWKMPPLGTFNLHSSLLPQYRGAAPINRVIMNGEEETGITTFFLRHDIDTGNILFQEKIAIRPDENAGALHDRLKIAGAELVLKTVRAIENKTISEIPQQELIRPGEALKTAPKIFSTDCSIDWNRSALDVHNQVRGLSPFPGAFTKVKDASGNILLLKIFRTERTNEPSRDGAGTITVSNGKMYIQCSDQLLEIMEVQQEGRGRNSVSNFLRGFRLEKGWKAIDGN